MTLVHPVRPRTHAASQNLVADVAEEHRRLLREEEKLNEEERQHTCVLSAPLCHPSLR